MAFETGTDQLTCPDCGAQHKAEWHRMPMRDWQRHLCQKCDGVLVQGNSVKDFVRVTLIADT